MLHVLIRFSNQNTTKPFTKMAFKYVVLATLLAVANAGYLGAPVASPLAYSSPYAHGIASPALVSQQNNILRTPGNLGQVSTYSKTISTPYSSVSKSDVRVSNDALVAPYAHGYAAPALAHGYAAPALAHGYAAPTLAHGYAAPLAARVAAPYAASYAAPYAAAHPAGLLGVAYSAAPAVAHISYSNGLGINYAY